MNNSRDIINAHEVEENDNFFLVGQVYCQNGFYNFYPTRKIVNNSITWLDNNDKLFLLSSYNNITIDVDITEEHNQIIKTKVSEFVVQAGSSGSDGVGCVIFFHKFDLIMRAFTGTDQKRQHRILQLAKLLHYKENNEIICEDKFYHVVKNDQIFRNYSCEELRRKTEINLASTYMVRKENKYFITDKSSVHGYIGPFECKKDGLLHRMSPSPAAVCDDKNLIKGWGGNDRIYYDASIVDSSESQAKNISNKTSNLNSSKQVLDDNRINKPYKGDEPYIFISYSHLDSKRVLGVISNLQFNGYRVWYDEGIDPGTEWDENIAIHIEKSGYVIAFMSNNYLKSNNCKDELNYARDLDKNRLIVYLEETNLPSGMKMRLNRLQSIFKYKYVQEFDFYEKLFSADKLDVCKGKINKNSVLSENNMEKRE